MVPVLALECALFFAPAGRDTAAFARNPGTGRRISHHGRIPPSSAPVVVVEAKRRRQ